MFSAVNFRRSAFSLFAIVAAVCFAGCPSQEPKKAAPGPEKPSASASKDDEKAIAALKAMGATVNLDKAGNVGEVILSAECTNDEMKHVAALPHCTILAAEVHGISGEGLAHLKGHPSLKILRLAQSDVKNEDARYLLDIPKLEDVDLKKTNVTVDAYQTLAQHKTLRKIRAAETKFDNDCLQAIAGMQQLVALDLNGCELITAEGATQLANLPNLEMLKLYGPGIDNSSLETIGKLAQLKILGLRKTQVSNEGMKFLAGLAKLKELDLSESNIGQGEGFAALAAVQTLVDFNVWATDFSDADMAAVGQLKNLKRLNLDKTKVTDVGLESVKDLANLEYIHLGKTTITDHGLAHLHGLKKLKTVIVTVVPGVTADGAAELQKAIPGVDVKR